MAPKKSTIKPTKKIRTKPKTYTMEQVAEAFRAEHGIMDMVADRLKVDLRTIHNYLVAWPELKEVRKEAQLRVGRKAKANLANAVEKGNLEVSKYWLAHKCKKEWGEQPRKLHLGQDKDAGPVQTEATVKAIQLPLEKQAQILAILESGETDE